jgi:hypothetical protein
MTVHSPGSSTKDAHPVRRTLGLVLVAAGLVASSGLGARTADASSQAWQAPAAIPSAISSGAPALATYQKKLYAFYIGQAEPSHIFYSAFNGKKWTTQAEVPSALTNQYTGVGIAVYNGSLYVAWEGSGVSSNPNPILYSAFNGSTWTPQATVPSAETYQYAYPALAAYAGKLYVEWYGSNGTNLWYSAFNGTSWSAQAEIPGAKGYGQVIEIGPALTVYKSQLFTIWSSTACCDYLDYAEFNGGTWTTPGTFVADFGANHGLGLAVFNKILYAGWDGPYPGSTGDSPVDYSTYNGSWLAIQGVPSAQTGHGPALAAYGGKLFVAWNVYGTSSSGPIDYSSGP